MGFETPKNEGPEAVEKKPLSKEGRFRAEIEELNRIVQKSEGMERFGKEHGFNRDETYKFIEDKILENEKMIREKEGQTGEGKKKENTEEDKSTKAKNEEGEKQKEGPKIKIPEDPELVNALRDKLAEYKERLAKQMKNDPYKPPEAFSGTVYKMEILLKLLKDGEVDMRELSKELGNKYVNLNAGSFNNAYAVIDDYAKTGGGNVLGGGLKFEQTIDERKNEGFLKRPELKKVFKIKRGDEKAAALEDFKEKFAEEKKGFAKLQEEMIKRVRLDPDGHTANREYLKEKSAKLGATPAQTNDMLGIFEEYARKHDSVRAIRKEHPDNAELFETLFGKKPAGKIEVVEGPMTLYFKCRDTNDYALIHSGAFVENRAVTNDEFEKAMKSAGCSINTSRIPGLGGTIIAENTTDLVKGSENIHFQFMKKKYIEKKSEDIRAHEEQHAFKALFRESFAKKYIAEKSAVNGYLRFLRERIAEPRAKDEILAFFKDGMSDRQIVLDTLTRAKEDGGIYDYWEEYLEKNKLPKAVKESLHDPEYNKKFFERANSVFRDEYRAMVENGLRNLLFLRIKGYSKDEIIGLLISEPLSRWPKVIGRLVEAERIKEKKKKTA